MTGGKEEGEEERKEGGRRRRKIDSVRDLLSDQCVLCFEQTRSVELCLETTDDTRISASTTPINTQNNVRNQTDRHLARKSHKTREREKKHNNNHISTTSPEKPCHRVSVSTKRKGSELLSVRKEHQLHSNTRSRGNDRNFETLCQTCC